MAKSNGKKKTGKKKTGKKIMKKNKKEVVIKTDMTVVPVTTPDGSVHFDEFLKVCKEPKLPIIPIEPVTKIKSKKSKKGKKGKRSKKGKKGLMNKTKKKSKAKKTKKTKHRGKKRKLSNKKVVIKPNIMPPPLNETDSYPKLFPLTTALLLPPTDNDAFADTTLFPEFVVGKTEPPVLRNQASIQVLDVMEQQANKTVDEINRVQEQIKSMMQKTDLNDSETVELENHNLMLMVLLEDFENSLTKILRIYHKERAETLARLDGCNGGDNDDDENDEDGWFDVTEEESSEKKETPESRWPGECDNVESQHNITNIAKWYEVTDLAYLLSPNSSFNKGATRRPSVSSSLLSILNELKETNNGTSKKDARRNQVFRRLKNKFNILLPPPRPDGTKENLQWLNGLDEKLQKDHLAMLNATKNLKIFQCWDQLELKYNIVHALIVSLQDAIKSTSPFFYASTDVKSKFLTDQSVLVQALDDFKRETSRTFAEVGLADYWKCHPQSIRLCSQPCFDVTIRRRVTEVDHVVPPDERRLAFLQRSPFSMKYNCKSGFMKKINSEDSEIEVDTIHFN